MHFNKGVKMFQKPNILRKSIKPNAAKKSNETVDEVNVVCAAVPAPVYVHAAPSASQKPPSKHRCSKPNHRQRKVVQRITLDSYICDEYRIRKLQARYLHENGTDQSKMTPASELAAVRMCERQPASNPIAQETEAEGTSIPLTNELFICSEDGCGQLCKSNDEFQEHAQVHYATKSESLAAEEVSEDKREIQFVVPAYQIITYNLQNNNKDIDQTYVVAENETVTQNNTELPNTTHYVVKNQLLEVDSWSCITCSCTFSSLEALTEHMNSHTDPTPFKCDWSGCDRLFVEASKLRRHRAMHGRAALTCPARPPGQRCLLTFTRREDLVRHLRHDHSCEEDAPFRCEICDRRFFWSSGLRAHARSHAASGRPPRAVHACSWPDCSRVFFQPCRLREHSRTHTGDKPYFCHYPSCGWSFRTASKLGRHARAHTNERRHSCSVCGKAFLRTDHLREHGLLHAPKPPHLRHRCLVPAVAERLATLHAVSHESGALARRGCAISARCEQRFLHKSSLYVHQKRGHAQSTTTVSSEEKTEPTQPPVIDNPVLLQCTDFPTAVELESPSPVPDSPEEYHSARTHCTWPLQSRLPPATPDEDVEYVPPPDSIAAELADSSDNNVYSTQEDVFLHGNSMHASDDSAHSMAVNGGNMELVLLPGTQLVSEDSTRQSGLMLNADTLSLDTELGLLDATGEHINNFLQEELLYMDTANDEASFQILLLSGDQNP